MLTLEQAYRIVQEGSRYEHSVIVGSIMKTLAQEWGQDTQLWALVGVLHDIDWDETQDTKEKHGIIAAERLEGKLPEEALHAIMSHDYRTGVKPASTFDHALIFADALAHIFSNMKTPEFSYPLFENTMETVSEQGRPWMKEIIQNYVTKNNLSPKLIEKLWHSSILLR